jgi:hypothetical protein
VRQFGGTYRKQKNERMIETFTDFLKSISDYLIKGIFISILLIIFIKLISKTKIETVLTTKIIKWVIIIYSFGVLVNTILMFIFPPTEKYAFLERATGPYWWAYWLMVSMNSIIPLILLNKKIGRKTYFLLIISLLMNVGWLFESFVIHMTSLHRDFVTESYNPYLPNNRELLIIFRGLIFGIVLLIVENVIKTYWKTEYETLKNK